MAKEFNLSCPAPTAPKQVQLAHGSGGQMAQRLLEEVFWPAFQHPLLGERHDGAVFAVGQDRLAFTTDSYVIHPLFFPGGDIGSLAIHGTVNDLAMCGAEPLYLSAAFILEEGLPLETLERVVASMRRAAERCAVALVTGDTKVVDKGKGDGLYINTSGIGLVRHAKAIGPRAVRSGDAVIVSGDIGRHGIAVMGVREGLSFENPIESDSAPVAEPVQALLKAGIDVHCLRDATRGGLASVLVEISETAQLSIVIEEASIPVREDVRGACEVLGLDPLYVANEGRFVAFVPEAQAEQGLAVLRAHPVSAGARRIGSVAAEDRPAVSMKSVIGGRRLVDRLSGDPLPRIC